MKLKDLYKKVFTPSVSPDLTSTPNAAVERLKAREYRHAKSRPEHNGTLIPETDARTAEKERLVLQFRKWLDAQPEIPAARMDTPETGKQTDLYSLFAEFIALKGEIKIESRQFKSAFDDFRKTLELLETGYKVLQKEAEGRIEGAKEIRFLATQSFIVELLEIRDRVEDSQQVMATLKPKILKRKYRKKKALLSSMKQGQTMLLNRIEKLLQNHDVLPIEAAGQPFDPHKMRAVEIDCKPKKENGIVLTELRKGYTRHDEVIRVAEVKVNKCA